MGITCNGIVTSAGFPRKNCGTLAGPRSLKFSRCGREDRAWEHGRPACDASRLYNLRALN
ncbi:MAG: hypothetical protein H7831_01805 [Magnetococcus sp. WYHC-3]